MGETCEGRRAPGARSPWVGAPGGSRCGRRAATFPERRPRAAPRRAVCPGGGRFLPAACPGGSRPNPEAPAAPSDPPAPLWPSHRGPCPPPPQQCPRAQWSARPVLSEMPSRVGFSKAKPRGPPSTVACRAMVRAPSLGRRGGIMRGLPVRRRCGRGAQGARYCLPPPTQRSSAPSGFAPNLAAPRSRRLDSPGTLPGGCCA